LIKSYNLADKVFLKGYASDLKKTYAGFDVFVLTSSHEGIPYVILKSMSAKVPIVSTEVGGINEIITNNINGLLVPFADIDGLKNSVLKLVKDNSSRNSIVNNAYLDYKNKWTVEKTICKMEEIYSRNI
jgi:glycosyltransferase involved in cell wall biosynthesis